MHRKSTELSAINPTTKATLVDLSPLSHDTRSENETGLFYSSSRAHAGSGAFHV